MSDEGGFWMSYYYCLKYANKPNSSFADWFKTTWMFQIIQYIFQLVILSGICGPKVEKQIQETMIQELLQRYLLQYPNINQIQLQHYLTNQVAKQRDEYKFRFWCTVLVCILMILVMVIL